MKRYAAEFFATFILVFFAAGSSAVNEITNGSVTLVGCAIVSGIVVMAMIFSVGDISGAHMNPAVTIAFALNKNFTWKDVLPYILSQVAGSIAAGFLLRYVFPSSVFLGATLPAGLVLQSFILETITAFLLMFVILSVATGAKETGMFAGLAIGFVVLADIILAGPISGGSMNPVRSVGPALASDHLQHLWIYLTAPVVGTVSAVFIHRYFKT